MTTVMLTGQLVEAAPVAKRVPWWRRPLALLRKVLDTVRERFAEGRRLTALAVEYRERPTLERARGVHYSSHRAPRVRRRPSARAPKAARHTPAPGRRHVTLPPNWRQAVHAGRAVASHRWAWARPSVAEILAGV